MNAIQLLKEQLQASHENLDATTADASEEMVHFTDTNKALPVGAAYAHAVCTEDMVVNGMLTQNTPVSKATETGLSELMPSFAEWERHEAWAKSVKVDLAKFKSYAQKVYQATDAYLDTLTEADLEKKIEIPGMGTHTVSGILSNFIILHNASLTGEISAAKGFQGHKGYPF